MTDLDKALLARAREFVTTLRRADSGNERLFAVLRALRAAATDLENEVAATVKPVDLRVLAGRPNGNGRR